MRNLNYSCCDHDDRYNYNRDGDDTMTSKQGNLGFTLIEAIIGVAIGSILLLTSVNIYIMSSQQQSLAQSQFAFRGVVGNMLSLLNNMGNVNNLINAGPNAQAATHNTCSDATNGLGGIVVTPVGTPVDITRVIALPGQLNTPIFSKGQTSPDGLQFTSLTLSTYALIPNTTTEYSANLHMQITIAGPTLPGGNTLFADFPLIVYTNAGGAITSCFGAGADSPEILFQQACANMGGVVSATPTGGTSVWNTMSCGVSCPSGQTVLSWNSNGTTNCGPISLNPVDIPTAVAGALAGTTCGSGTSLAGWNAAGVAICR